MQKERPISTSIGIEPSKCEKLDEIAYKNKKSRSQLIREIIEDFLSNQN